jgi:hypothetical protein
MPECYNRTVGGDCRGNNWCQCGTVKTAILDSKNEWHDLGPEQVGGPRGFYKTEVGEELEIYFQLEGFGGSVSQSRIELTHSATVTINHYIPYNKPVTLPIDFPKLVTYTREGPDQIVTISEHSTSFKYKFDKVGWYMVGATFGAQFKWNGDDGSCSFACTTIADQCRNNTSVMIVVEDKKSPSKQGPTIKP